MCLSVRHRPWFQLFSLQRFPLRAGSPSGAALCSICAPQRSVCLCRWLLAARAVIGHRTVALRHRQYASALWMVEGGGEGRRVEGGAGAEKQRRQKKKKEMKKKLFLFLQLETNRSCVELKKMPREVCLSNAAAHLTIAAFFFCASAPSREKKRRGSGCTAVLQVGERERGILPAKLRSNKWDDLRFWMARGAPD